MKDLIPIVFTNILLQSFAHTYTHSDGAVSTNTSNFKSADKIEKETISSSNKNVETLNKIQPQFLYKTSNFPEDEANVFKELEMELGFVNTERTHTAEEMEMESNRIFKELFEEASSSQPSKNADKNSLAVQRITDTIAKFVLRKNSPDSNILGTLSNILKSQLVRLRRKK